MLTLLAIGIFICGFVVGWLTVKFIVLNRLKKVLKIVQQLEDDTPKSVALVFEKVGDQIFAYTDEGHEFMAQGSSKEELIETLTSRFPSTSFTANSVNMSEVFGDAAKE